MNLLSFTKHTSQQHTIYIHLIVQHCQNNTEEIIIKYIHLAIKEYVNITSQQLSNYYLWTL